MQHSIVQFDNDLAKIHIRASNWLVSFNPSKSESSLISRRLADIYHPDLVMNNYPIQEVDSHKQLGVVFSNDGIRHE